MDKFVIKKIRDLKRLRPDSSWLESQKSFLLSEIGQEKRKPSLVLPLFNFNILKILKPNFAVALAIIVLLTSFGTFGVISAAQNSLPGDFLYPVKTAFEQTQLTFSPGEASKAKLSIKMATQRMDEFTQLVSDPEKKEDLEKTVEKFTQKMIIVQEEIDKLKDKNSEKAAEVAILVKAQATLYEEALIKGNDRLAYIIPEDKEKITENINEALLEINRVIEQSEEMILEENSTEPVEASEQEIIVPAENVEHAIESSSFENLNEEIPLQEE